MSFVEWITSSYPNPSINGRWGLLHILTLLACIAIVVLVSVFLRGKSEKAKRRVLWCFLAILMLFEVTRRVVNFAKTTDFSFLNILHILLPRPWCAISSFMVFLSCVLNKRFLYNTTSITGLLCTLVFFAYPGVGFNNTYILFENLYSIATHSLIFILSLLFMTLKMTKFEFKNIHKDLVVFAGILVYALFEIFVLEIESDPMYFMPGNDIVEVLGVPYPVFLILYILFVVVYFSMFYIISSALRKRKKKDVVDKMVDIIKEEI